MDNLQTSISTLQTQTLTWYQRNKGHILAGAITAFFCILAIAGLAFYYKTFIYKAPVREVYNAPPPAKGMPPAPTKEVIVKYVMVYDKKKAENAMNLPPEIVNDPKKELVATSKLKPSDGGYTVASVLDTTTGVTVQIAKEEKRPLFGFMGKSSVGVLGGVSNQGNVAVGYVAQDLVRVGIVELGAAGGAGVVGNEALYGAVVNIHGSW